MNKKQFGIIFTLLALIVCVGLLAMKLNNGGLTDPSDIGAIMQPKGEDGKKDDKETSKGADYFYDIRSERDKNDQESLQTWNSIIDNENTTKEQKEAATKKINEKNTMKDQERRVEVQIKNSGFDDALCFIENKDKVRVVVKSKDGLDEKRSNKIREIVQNITNISDVVIELKK